MKRLYGKKILVGRSQQGNVLNVNVVGINKVGVINRTVPGSVSRLVPEAGTAHLSLTIDDKGCIKAQNLKDANCTYVNGQEIRTKTVMPDAVLELGNNRFQISVQDILNAATKLVGQKLVPKPDPDPKPTFNVHHLRRIWDDYKAACKQIQIERIIAQRKQRLPLIASGGISAITTMAAWFGGSNSVDGKPTIFQIIAGLVAITSFIFLVYFMFRDPSIELTEKKEQLDKELEHMYVCPNPECNKMLYMKDIDFILKQYEHKCPYCKCNYVDKY